MRLSPHVGAWAAPKWWEPQMFKHAGLDLATSFGASALSDIPTPAQHAWGAAAAAMGTALPRGAGKNLAALPPVAKR